MACVNCPWSHRVSAKKACTEAEAGFVASRAVNFCSASSNRPWFLSSTASSKRSLNSGVALELTAEFIDRVSVIFDVLESILESPLAFFNVLDQGISGWWLGI